MVTNDYIRTNTSEPILVANIDVLPIIEYTLLNTSVNKLYKIRRGTMI